MARHQRPGMIQALLRLLSVVFAEMQGGDLSLLQASCRGTGKGRKPTPEPHHWWFYLLLEVCAFQNRFLLIS